MNNPFSTSDSLVDAAAAVLFSEDLTTVKKNVETVKVGDKTNFGVVKEIGDTFISFKGKDTPVTKIPFNQRKVGSKDFVLDKLMKLKEEVENLDEAVYTPKSADAKKALAIITETDDIDDLVEFMKGLSSYYADYAKQNDNEESKAFAKHLTAAFNVVKDWH